MKTELSNQDASLKIVELIEELEKGGCITLCQILSIVVLHISMGDFFLERMVGVMAQLARLMETEYKTVTGDNLFNRNTE